MSYCIPCEAANNKGQNEALKRVKAKAIEYAKSHNQDKIFIVQTRNKPAFKREGDPDLEIFPIIEILYID